MNKTTLTEYMSGRIEAVFRDIMKSDKASLKLTGFLAKLALQMAKSEKLQKKYRERGIAVPKLLVMSACDKCTLSCPECISRELDFHGDTILSAEQIDSLLSDAASIGIMLNIVAGGEVLLRQSVLRTLARHDELLSLFFTNGAKLPEQLELLTKNRNLIPVVTVDADEAGGIIEKNGNQDIKALKLLSAQKLIFGAAAVIEAENFRRVTSDAFVENIIQSGCDLLFLVAHPPKSRVLLAPEEMRELASRLEYLSARYPKLLIVSFPMAESTFGGCIAEAGEMLYVDPYGNIAGCPYLPGSGLNIKTTPLLTALSQIKTSTAAGEQCLSHYKGAQ